jgi:hypothetical protein
MSEPTLYRTAVKIGPSTVGISSNRRDHLPRLPARIEVKSLLTDFHRVDTIDFEPGLDGYIEIWETDEPPKCAVAGNTITLRGPLQKLEQSASDPRYSLWGNLGMLYRFTLYLLETRHRIFNLHACALYDPEPRTLYVVAGGAGSGKTVYLLSGLQKGLRLVSTETVHLELLEGGSAWHMGSLVDNIRLATLKFDFPQFLEDMSLPAHKDIWQEKMALDLSCHRWEEDIIHHPTSIILLFPHIEQGRLQFILRPIRNRHRAARRLFDNASEKLSESLILYDTIAVPGFETAMGAQQRLNAMQRFVQDPHIKLMAEVLAAPQNCWGDILPETNRGENRE